MDDKEKDKMLEELINNLAQDYELDDKKLKNYVTEFKKIYSDKYRHEYSNITRVLFSLSDDEQRDYLPEKIKNIRDQITDGDVRKSLDKLWDHINLENIRSAELRKISVNAQRQLNTFENKINKTQEDIKDDVGEIYNKMDEVNKKMESAQISYVSILGIFSSITFALFGGLDILAQVFSKVTNLSDHNTFWGIMAIGGFVAFSIFNLLNVLLYSIGRIVNRDIISIKCGQTCEKYKNNICDCKWYKKIFVKYTYITILNIVFIIFIIASSIIYLIG
jgi:hypothetical protein